MSLVSVDSTTVRAHHDAARMRLDPDTLAGLEKAAEEAEIARQKGAARRNKTGSPPQTTRTGKSDGASEAGTSSG